MLEARAIQNTSHADQHVGWQARKFLQSPDHHIQRIGDTNNESIWRMGFETLTDRLHHFQINAHQIIAAHAGFARHTGSHDAHISAGNGFI